VKIASGSVEAGAESVVHALLGILIFKRGDVTGTLFVKAELAPVVMNVIAKLCTIKNEAQTNFGDEMKYFLGISPGNYSAFRTQLDKVTKGVYRFDVGQIDLYEESQSSSSHSPHQHSTKEERKAEAAAFQLVKEAQKQEKANMKKADSNRNSKQEDGTEEEAQD